MINEYKDNLDKASEIETEEEKSKRYWQDQIDWITSRFPEGKYQDVVGLCKVATIEGEDGIEDQDWSLNAGRYVGVVIEDDGMTDEQFKEKILSLQTEFEKLTAESKKYESEISTNLKGLFGE